MTTADLSNEPTEIKTLTGLLREAHARARASGWWDEYDANTDVRFRMYWIAAKIALVHSEVSESLEAFRKDAMDDHLPTRRGIEVEFGDAIIRMFDLAGGLGLDLEAAIIEKMVYNSQRADHTSAVRGMTGGKKL